MRVAIVGNPGSGKTTLARAVAERTGALHLELDSFYHLENWTPQDRAVMRAQLDRATAEAESWVVDGNYNSICEDFVQGRADTIVFFELPRGLVTRRVAWRTLRRAVRREELWNGNREPLTNFYRWDPERNIIRWAWTHHAAYSERYRTKMRDGAWDHATVIHAQTSDDADRWLDSLPRRASA